MSTTLEAASESYMQKQAPKIAEKAYLAVWAAVIVLTALILTVDFSREVTGILTLALVLALLLAGIPIGFGMLGASVIGLAGMRGFQGVTGVFQELIYSSTASWSLSVIPLFILMGIALWKSGITAKAFDAARQWLGGVPGGLAVATNFSGAGLAAASGSSIGISYALGRIAIPEMLKVGYKPTLATGSVAMVGTLGQLIPPSILLVVYAGVAQTPVGPQLMAAIVPGVLLAIVYSVYIIARSMFSPTLAPKADMTGVTMGTRMASLVGMLPLTAIIVVVIGGMFIGAFTPTEAGAVGALSAIVIGWVSGRKEHPGLRGFLSFMKDTLTETVISAAGIFVLLIGVNVLTRMLTVSRLTNFFTEWLVGIELNTFVFLAMLAMLFLIMGMFLDPLAIIMLAMPILAAPLTAMGIDLIWFGIFLIMLAELGLVSPPVGILSFIVHRITREPSVNLGHDISLTEVFRGVLPFIAVTIIFVAILTVFPQIVLWLPGISAS